MRTYRSVFTHSLAAACGISALALLGAGRPASPAAQPDMDPAKMQEAMQRWMDSMKTGPNHEFLKQFVGEWETKTSMGMGGPGAPPMTAKGTATISLIHDGKFIKQETKGKMPLPGADMQMKEVDFTGLGLTGYDNNRRLFTMSWTDSLTTGIMTGTGNLSQDKKTLTMFGTMDEPMTGEIGKTVRYITHAVDKDSFKFEIAEVLYGEAFTVVTVEYTRKK